MIEKFKDGETLADYRIRRTTYDSAHRVVHPHSWDYIDECSRVSRKLGLSWGDVMHAHLRVINGMLAADTGDTPAQKEHLRAVLMECLKTGDMGPLEAEMAKP